MISFMPGGSFSASCPMFVAFLQSKIQLALNQLFLLIFVPSVFAAFQEPEMQMVTGLLLPNSSHQLYACDQ